MKNITMSLFSKQAAFELLLTGRSAGNTFEVCEWYRAATDIFEKLGAQVPAPEALTAAEIKGHTHGIDSLSDHERLLFYYGWLRSAVKYSLIEEVLHE